MSDMTEKEQLAAFIEGDATAQEAFRARYKPVIGTAIRKAVGGRRELYWEWDFRDLEGQVWIELLERDCAALRRFKGKSSLSTYLHQLAYRVTLRSAQAADPSEVQQVKDARNRKGEVRPKGLNPTPAVPGDLAAATTGLHGWNLSVDGSFSYDDV